MLRDGERPINIGSEDGKSSTFISSTAPKPDAISVKQGAAVNIRSTQTQIIGSVDMAYSPNMSDFSAILGELENMSATRLSGVFSGENAFWFGDEYSFANMDSVDSNNPLLPIGMQFAANASKDALNFTFENGAQWTYFGVANSFSSGSTTVNYTPKRISKITLRNGGIINLFDDDIKRLWQEMGLDEVYPEIMSVEHDYVCIGTLLGDGGIFRLNLNAEDKSKSDLIFVENAERDPDGVQPHTHYIEPYDLKLLHSITPDNTLIFALVNSTASHYGVGFKDKQNLFGESLFDYELEIASRPLTEEDLSRDELNPDKRPDLGFVEDDFQAGGIDPDTVWYIRRVTLSESAAAMEMTGAGFASYNAAIEMDRRDLRLTQTVRSSQDPENGLWVRLHHGQNGIDHQYEWDRTGVTVGVDRKTSDVNRVDVYFSYTDGDTDFLDVDGSGDMQRYELAIFDTVEFGSHYLDFVGRIGRISSSFAAGNEKYRTSADYDQDYAAVSAEYGYMLKDAAGVFVEPQVQLQAAYLDSYDYSSERGMHVEAESDTSIIGRAGLRAGREFSSESSIGQLYFRGDLLHQFTDGQSARFLDENGARINKRWGDMDTWAAFGLGAAWQWLNGTGLQVDIERSAGGKVDNTWLISGRVNYRF